MRSLYLRPSDLRTLCQPSGPFFIFCVPWLLVIAGQLAALCNIIVPVYSSLYLIVIGNMVSLLLIGLIYQTLLPQKLKPERPISEDLTITGKLKNVTYSLIMITLLGELFQALYFKGFPLLWLLQGNASGYLSYGIGSLNGLLNALYLLSTTSLLLIYFHEGKRWQIVLYAMLLLIPIMMISRQVLISAAIQGMCCTLLLYPQRWKRIGLLLIALLTAFIIIGNYRTGIEHLVEILDPSPSVPEILYPLLWVYAYVVTPFNNLNAAIDSITPYYAPVHELYHLIPSVIRPNYVSDINTGFNLVHSNMTVSTFYLSIILDFGKAYAFSLMVLIQVYFVYLFRRALRTKSPIHLIEYSVLYMIIALSFFENLLFFLPVIFQLVILNLVKLRVLRK